jgi:RND family efflux transporter MFP subunit
MTMATKNRRRWLAVLSSLGVVALSSACGGSNAASQPPSSTPAAGPPIIATTRVVERPLEVQLSLPGELKAYQSVDIFPRVTGFVKTVSVDRGSKVRAGDVLAVLEAPELVAQRAEAQSKLQGAEAQLAVAKAKADADTSTFERLKAASATPGVVAGNELVIAEKSADASRNQVVAAQQSAEAMRQALSAIRDMEGYLRITAPFAGVVTERNVHPGALVGPVTGASVLPLVRLVDNTRLRLVVPVPEAYTTGSMIGTAITFSVAAHPGQQFTGKVARVAQAVDVSSRTMAVELDVANGDALLAPGTFSQVQWPIRRAGPSLFVPSSSVAATTDRTFVIRVRGGKTEWVDVKTGLTSGALVEVFGDLKSGDEVAERGTDELRPATDVRVKESKPAA